MVIFYQFFTDHSSHGRPGSSSGPGKEKDETVGLSTCSCPSILILLQFCFFLLLLIGFGVLSSKILLHFGNLQMMFRWMQMSRVEQ